MNVVGYGGGTDSTAMLVGLWRHHVPVDLILFADPGAEQPHTYAYLDTMSRWLENHGMPAAIVSSSQTSQRIKVMSGHCQKALRFLAMI